MNRSHSSAIPVRKDASVSSIPKSYNENSHSGVEYHNAFIATTKSIDQEYVLYMNDSIVLLLYVRRYQII